MYRVTLYDNPNELNGIVIHHPYVGGEKIEGTIKDEINKIDTFEFGMTLENPGYGKIRPLLSFLKVSNTRSHKTEFKGRVYGPSESMDESGLVDVAYACEGELSYLTDSMQRHLEFRGSAKEGLTTMLDWHNGSTEDYKHFEVGVVEIEDPNDLMYFYLNAETNTLDAIFDKLVDKLGGELQIRYENGVRYLDWLERIGHESETEIRLARNLMSISRDTDPGEIVTRLTPLGERIESEDDDATDASQERLGIASINNGKPYIDRPDLIELFGIQGGSVTWDNVTTPERVMSNGQRWMDNQKLVLQQFQVGALDLATIGKDVDSFEKGNSHYTKNPVMAIDEWLRIIATQKDINAPENSSLTIGDKFLSGTDYRVQQKKSAERVSELQGQLDSQSRRAIQLRHAYQRIADDIEGVQQDLINVDLDDLPAELQSLHAQLEAIQTAIGNLPIVDLTPLETELASLTTRVEALEHYVPTINDLVTRVEVLENQPPIDPEESE